ncbi:coiled-coil domain-containing protein 148 [Trichonephila inaurata madagascariensis]|uniref:Coiled-coil domain-containing protein 148 n=1 Tax=Trichonephila inaurata madagascariensis TaxID=2747483 RepID=A0A8X6WW78_9ARAC|nr:coiled-coil domain-containing protein 148 [Trichonephila inaurata madagascariensis]
MKEEKSDVMAEVALTRGVEVLPSINSNSSISKLEKNKNPTVGSPTKTVDPTKGSPKKRKMLRFTGVPRTRPDVSPTRALKPLHNDRINGLAAAKKSTNRILERADHFKTVTQSKKELALLYQHKVIWEQEYMHLQYMEDRLQREIYNHLTIYGQLGADGQLLLADNINFILEIEEEKAFFRENVVDPLWYIREDLKEWVRQHEGLRPLSEAAKLQHYQIKREVKELWAGYKEIAEDLLKEQRELEQQVKEALPHYIAEEKQIAKGVPPEFHELYCPDPQLKENLIAELTRLDDSYSNRLRDLDRNCDRQASPGGWNDHDAALFEHILEQYPADLPDRRVLCFDRLKRTFPHKTLGQLMSYETWYQNNRFHKDRRKKCLEDWARERWSWLLRAVTEISQAQQSHAGHQLSRDEALRQKFKCEVLRQRVEQWRKEKENERMQQSEMEAQRKLALKVVQQRQAAKEEYRRELARQRLAAYYEERLRFQKESEDALQRRMDDARKMSKDRSKHDKERVRYRTELFYANQKERRERMLKLREEEKARQQRLDQLRKQVQVSVDPVPERIHQDTVASQARKEASSEGLALKALHELRTVLDAEVHRDPRVRLEQQLREAGLLNSEYARHVLSQMHPPREPRKDTISSLFLQESEN